MTVLMLIKILRCAIVICVVVCPIRAQQNSGALRGTVTDQLDSLVVGATVILKAAGGATTRVTTNSAGVYEFKRLAPGSYELAIVSPGFNQFEEKNVQVRARETTTFNAQLTVAFEEQEVTIDDRHITTDSDNNANAVVLRGRDLEALPNDPDSLAAALQAMAGPVDPEAGGAQIKVDGFSNGQIPPKEAIREVRINNNPFSAENEFPGFSGIEIFTQPGADKWHGSFSYDFNDESLNSRNPFTTRRAPYQQRAFNFSLSGPIIKKKASFSTYFGRYVSDANSIVNATTLDPVTLKPVTVNQSFVTPEKNTYGNGRLDYKLNKKHTLVGRFNYNVSTQDLQGIGGFSLPSRAYKGRRSNFTLQITETALINEKTVNETRFQWIRNRFNQQSLSEGFALNVLDSFFGGGSQVGAASNAQQRFELTNFTSWTKGNHFLKVGGRVRHGQTDSISPGNFGGTYTFSGGRGPMLDANDQVVLGPDGLPVIVPVSSLERYRRTLALERAGLNPAAIRLLGGGATQFSIAGGNPEAVVKQTDVAVYLQDEWKIRPNFTLSPGFRYENQNNIDSDYDFAPRIAFAWSPVFGGSKKSVAKPNATPATPAPAPGPPKTVIRGAAGYFYSRTSEDMVLQATRFNGVNQQQFLVTDPDVLNLFPLIPPVELLSAFKQPQSRRVINGDLNTARTLRLMFTVERSLPLGTKLSFTYLHNRASRTLRTVNINAPLGGTFIPGIPTSGVRPLGDAAGNVFEYQDSGHAVGNTLSININGNLKKASFWGGYNLNKPRNTDSGATGSPFDAYDFSHEWARSPFGSLSFAYAGGYVSGPHGISLNMFMAASSGPPFNITIGRDLNGDTLFSERPAFATNLTDPDIVITPLGAFDPTPSPGQTIIPRNFGRGPGYVSFQFNLSKVIKFGRAIEPKAPPPGAPRTTDAAAAAKPGDAAKPPAKPPVQRPYALAFTISANNIFNRNNEGPPVGNMTSPYFLKSTSGSNNFFGPGSGSGGNRIITLRVRLSF
jgi:carboxypeptidase family protein/TonB-dependent receptor-like protein